jgi:hypothetical protein
MKNKEVVCKFLLKAYQQYQEMVLKSKVRYERFVSIFLESNDYRYTNESEGERRIRMNHARELLLNRPMVAKFFFGQKDLDLENMEQIVDVINMTAKGTHFSEFKRNMKPVKTECQVAMDKDQLEKVAGFAKTQKLFKEEVSPEMLNGFFSDKATQLHANNNTHVVMFLDALTRAGLVVGLTPGEIERKGNLISSTGKKPLNSHAISSALNKNQNSPILAEWRKEMEKIAEKNKPAS